MEGPEAETRASSSADSARAVATALDHAPVAVWTLDGSGVVTWAGGGVLASGGIDTGRVVGRAATELIPRRTDLLVDLDRALAGEAVDHVLRTPDALWDVHLRPIHDRGSLVGAMGIAYDSTSRRRRDDEEREARTLETVARLAGGLAHEFNNLMMVVLGYGQILQEDLARLPGAGRAVDDLGHVVHAAERAAEISRQLLVFGRVDGRGVPGTCRVVDAVRDLGHLLRGLAGTGARLETELDPLTPAVELARADIDHLIAGLVANAGDASPAGARIAIRVSAIPPPAGSMRAPRGVPRPLRWCRIEVEDEGEGMDDATLQRALDPFFSTRSATDRAGLGLSTAYGLVRRAGGSMRLRSAPGAGTCVTIDLPGVVASPVEAVAPSPTADDRAARAAVLVVDDEPMVLDLIARVLRGDGHRVTTAGGATEAVALLDGGACFDLLVTDVSMPGTSGPELAAIVNDRDPRVKVVFVSGYPLDVGPHRAVSFLPKPVRPDELLATVRDLLGS
jgi:two-component system, cell cycle sensor histidine kinase and response regulator CckA